MNSKCTLWLWVVVGVLFSCGCSTSAAEGKPTDDFDFENVDDPVPPQPIPAPQMDNVVTSDDVKAQTDQHDAEQLKQAIKKATSPKRLPFCKKLMIADQVMPVCTARPKGACFCLGNPRTK